MLTLLFGEGQLSPRAPGGDRDMRKRVRRNAGEIGKFFEMRDPETQKGTAGSTFNLESDRKGESRVTLSARGHRALDNEDNAHFRRHVRPLLDRYEGRPFLLPAELLEKDPTALRYWRSAETEHARKMLGKFRDMCQFLARRIEIEHPGTIVYYHVNPREEESESLRAYSNTVQRWGKEHSYRIIAAAVAKVMEEEECSLRAALGLVSDREGCSWRRVEDAWYFAEHEKKGDTA